MEVNNGNDNVKKIERHSNLKVMNLLRWKVNVKIFRF